MDGSIRRSWLIVPSDDAAHIEQAATSAADVIMLDLGGAEVFMGVGESDLCRNLGMIASEEDPFVFARERLVIEGIAAGVQPICSFLIVWYEDPSYA